MKTMLCSAFTLALAGNLAPAVVWAEVRAQVPDAPEYGMLGGAQYQTIRVNVVAGDDPSTPYLLTLAFTDVLGRQVGPAKYMSLRPGQSDSLDLNFNTLVTQRGARAEVRPVIKYAENSGRCRFSVEIYDQLLQRTTVFGSPGVARAGAVSFPPVGLTQGQTLRLAVGGYVDPNDLVGLIDPNDKCAASIGFRASSGAFVDPNDKVSLAAGKWAFKDLNGTSLLKPGERAEFLPAVQMDPAANHCLATVQVFDQSSGWTTVYVPGAVVDPNN